MRLSFAILGILHAEKPPSQTGAQETLDTFHINTIGPLLLLKHFSPFPPKKSTVIAADEPGLPPHAV
jgi:hypothetical protein